MADHRSLDPAARLRLAREGKGMSLRQVAEATKLSVRAIEQLEKDQLSGLPNGIYRRSIIKSVAREVGLNPDELLSEFATLHPRIFPAPPSVVIAEPKAVTSFNKVLTIVSAVLPMFAGTLYIALPMTWAMVVGEPQERIVARTPRRSRAARRSFRSEASAKRQLPLRGRCRWS